LRTTSGPFGGGNTEKTYCRLVFWDRGMVYIYIYIYILFFYSLFFLRLDVPVTSRYPDYRLVTGSCTRLRKRTSNRKVGCAFQLSSDHKEVRNLSLWKFCSTNHIPLVGTMAVGSGQCHGHPHTMSDHPKSLKFSPFIFSLRPLTPQFCLSSHAP
jgi:hypothetical protein